MLIVTGRGISSVLYPEHSRDPFCDILEIGVIGAALDVPETA